MKNILAIAFLAIVFWGCQSAPTFHAYQDMPDSIWTSDSTTAFTFSIDDASVAYDLAYNIRHTRDYPYYNLYVQYELQNSAGTILRQQMHEVNLLHPQQGTPLGNGESLYDHRVPIVSGYKFEAPGTYRFRISQYMRTDSLAGVQAVGFTVMPTKQ